MTYWRAVAYVESPLQLLSAIEAYGYGLLGTETDLVIRDPHSTIAPTLLALKSIGLPAGLKVHMSKDSAPSAEARLTSSARKTKTRPIEQRRSLSRSRGSSSAYTPPSHKYLHVMGDPFSGQQQSGLLRHSGAHEIVILDDGLNTYAAIEALAAQKPLIRPGQTLSPARKVLGLATTRALRNAAFAGQLTIFTAMPATERMLQHLDVLDANVVFHEFPWISAQPTSQAIEEDRIIVGSGFAADGLIDPNRYVEWVEGLAQDTTVRYLPHRRTSPSVLDQIDAIDTVTVTTDNASVEVLLRCVQRGKEIHLLPTTALITLSSILRGRGVSIVPHAVPEDWWTDDTSESLREFLSRPLELFESTI